MSDSSERQAVIRRHHHDEVPGPVEAHRSVFEGDDGLRRLRLGVEIGSAALAVGFLVLTLIAPTWVEKLFGVSPDRGNGLWEWASVVLAGAVA